MNLKNKKNMNYQETLQYLFDQLPMFQRIGQSAYKANLDTTLALDTYFNHPHQNFKTIHVAGTNGKGSVSHMLASLFQASGYKTGLYTSPHLLDFRERIKINGAMITEKEVIVWVEQHKDIFTKLKPSFFEMTVAMAFDYFNRQQVDIAIIEVGMGGRLDSTNIITPLLSIITNISLDYTQFLGDSLAKIAGEKAGIIKPNIPVVIGEYNSETLPVFEQTAKRNNAPIVFASQLFAVNNSKATKETLREFLIQKSNNDTPFSVSIDLIGSYQEKNIVTVLTALEIIASLFPINYSNALSALKHTAKDTGLQGRWQVLCNHPYVVVDIAHNAQGLLEVTRQIKNCEFRNLHFVLGVVSDKDIDAMLKILPLDAKYYFTQPSIPRAMQVERLATAGKTAGFFGEAYCSVKEAIIAALNTAEPSDMIYIGGSAFVVADALECWQEVKKIKT